MIESYNGNTMFHNIKQIECGVDCLTHLVKFGIKQLLWHYIHQSNGDPI